MGHTSAIDPFPWGYTLIIVALIVLNGVFAMSELAIVSARRPRLQAMARKGVKGARTALDLGNNPGKFLSTIQIGITLIAVGVGAFSGASIEHPVAMRLEAHGISHSLSDTLGFTIVVTVLTFVTLILGELVPKQLALRAPEPIAATMAKPMLVMARATAPLVWLLDHTSALIFRMLGMTRESEHHVTAEELHLIFAEASRSGVIEENERAIISGVVRLADRPVREVMTPRTEVAWIDLHADDATLHTAIRNMRYMRLLVVDGTIDNVVGVLVSHDVLTTLLVGGDVKIAELMRPAPIIPDQVDAMAALELLRKAAVPLALVHDEYGHFEGIVTPADLLAAMVGDHDGDPHDGDGPAVTELAEGVLAFAGWAPVDALAERLGLMLPDDRDYATVAGFVLAQLKRLPAVGDHFTEQGNRFEVTQLDGRKIEQVVARQT
jgi:putative hemolysin